MKDEAAGIIAAIEDVKRMLNQRAANSTDTKAIDELTAKLSKTTSAATEQLSALREVVEAARKPLVKENRHTIDIASKGIISLLTVLIIAVVVLASALYFESRPNYDQRDNDLKYRYIKMKGEASPATISELETIFELDRDNAKIRQMLETVKTYEETVRKRAIADEQARLRQQELEQLDNEATKLKEK